jgi:hypothetical protein
MCLVCGDTNQGHSYLHLFKLSRHSRAGGNLNALRRAEHFISTPKQ